MPEKCRVGVCGYDPMLVRGYLKTGERALWWHISDELYEELDVKPGIPVSGKILGVYDSEGKKIASPNDSFEWKTSKESGLAVLLPPDVIRQYKLTEFHFLELIVEKIGDKPVYPGQEKTSFKWWPDDKMKLDYKVGYIE
ncbi:MAG: hypothetical protein M1377_00100 [Deltaproteobacteria bacterium]|nr:hypothetical protein [Deltaproteobacteria bacterium]